MSEKRDLWVPVLVLLCGLGAAAWDASAGRTLPAAGAALLGLAGCGGSLLLTLRGSALRSTGLALAAILLSGALSPGFAANASTLVPFALASLAVAFHVRSLPHGLRAAFLGCAGVLAVVATLAAIRVLPAARPAVGLALALAFACALQVWTSRPRPEEGPPPGPTIAVFGGSFDPFHAGHRSICEAVLKIASRLLVVVSARPPHKAGTREPTPFHHRVALARLGVEGLPRTEVLELEGRREGPSYMVDTLESLRRLAAPGTVYRLVLGADSLQDFPLWHDWEGILDRADLLVAARPGFDLDPPPEFEGRNAPIGRLEVNQSPASSTEIRKRIAAGEGLGEWVSPAVAAYIRDHGLYRSGAVVPPPESSSAPEATPRAEAGPS